MRVTIDHVQTTKGIFQKKTVYEVHTRVEFDSSEIAVIKQHKLDRVTILERQPSVHARGKNFAAENPDIFNLNVYNLLNSTDEYQCETPLEAKQYDGELREALRNLKAYLDANGSPVSGRDTFEL